MGIAEQNALDIAFRGQPFNDQGAASFALDVAFRGQPFNGTTSSVTYTSTLTATATAVVSQVLQAALVMSVTASNSPTWTPLKVILRAWTLVTAASSATVTKLAQSVRTVASTAVSAWQLQGRVGLAAAAGSTASVIRRTLNVLPAAVSSNVASWALGRFYARTLTATAGATATLARAVAKLLTLSSTVVADWVSQSATQVLLTLTATAGSAASLTKLVGFHVMGVMLSSAQIVRSVATHIGATGASAASSYRNPQKSLPTASAGAAGSLQRVGLMTLRGTAASDPRAAKLVGSNWATTGISTGAISRWVGKGLGVSVSGLASITVAITRLYRQTLTTLSVAVASVQRQAALTRSALSAGTATLARRVDLGWVYVSAAGLVFRKAIAASWRTATAGSWATWLRPGERLGKLIARFWSGAIEMATLNATSALRADASHSMVLQGMVDGGPPLSATVVSDGLLSGTVRNGVVEEGKTP